MKTFKQFCTDANIQENWFQDRIRDVRSVTNRLGLTKPTPPKPQPVLAYRNYQQGVGTGANWKRQNWSPEQQRRYGWRPVEITGYDPTGNLTASQKPLTQTSPPSVAVPYVSRDDKSPRIPFGTQLKFTNKPMGRDTKVIGATVTDTGRFGRQDSDSVNPKTFADASPTLQRLLNPSASSTTQFGKHMTYLKLPNNKTTKPKK